MKKILIILTIALGIPLLSYSQGNILPINEFQIKNILKDNAKLEYYKKQESINDSIEAEQEYMIRNLKEQILSYKTIEKNQIVEIDYWKSSFNKEKRKNRLIIIGSSVVSGFLLYEVIK